MQSYVPLMCPEHRTLLTHENTGYKCAAGCFYPVLRDIPRFVANEAYAASFGLQWNTFRRTQLDSYTGSPISRTRLTRIAGGSLDSLRGRDVLEAGCGAGRFTEVLLGAGARVFAVDISSAVDANFANCGSAETYFVCQADIARAPVPPASFDVVACIGVIQHTPDPEVTMSALCRYVKPGGMLLIDHYPPDYAATATRRVLRAWLLRRDSAASMRFCEKLIDVLWPLHRAMWKRFGKHASRPARKLRSLFLRLSPVVDYHDAYAELGPELLRLWALLDTHDTLTDRYKHLRSREQIERHLRSCGMSEVHATLGGNGVEVRAIKALDPSSRQPA